MTGRRRRGFTLIEMLIVIVVIAILALIVIPRLLSAGQKAKEAALKGDLHMLRNAVQQFEADCGDYPAALDQLMSQPMGDPQGNAPKGGNGIALDTDKWQGPYLRTVDGDLPKDPFTGTADWKYGPETGDVHSASTMTAINGEHYSDW